MSALETNKKYYERYLELSGGELPDRFRESDEIVRTIADEIEAERGDWMFLPIGVARILNLYRRWNEMEKGTDADLTSNIQLFSRFCDMCFRQVEKARLNKTEWRYEALTSFGVTPESITLAFATDPLIEEMHDDVISAYAIPFFGKDPAFIDLITNKESSYREGDAFHELVADEIERDRVRRDLKAKSRLRKAFA